jgi:hypothetical protein
LQELKAAPHSASAAARRPITETDLFKFVWAGPTNLVARKDPKPWPRPGLAKRIRNFVGGLE